jgi:hypothetical protein
LSYIVNKFHDPGSWDHPKEVIAVAYWSGNNLAQQPLNSLVWLTRVWRSRSAELPILRLLCRSIKK